MSSIFSAASCLSVSNAQIHLSEFYQNGEKWGVALYTSSRTLIVIHSKLEVGHPGSPEIFCAPWHMWNGPEIVALAFHPLGLRIVAATSIGSLVLMRTKEDVVGSSGPGFLPPHLEIELNAEQCGSRAMTKVLWWETVDGQHMVIIGTWTAGLVVVDLRLGKAIASVAVPEPVEDLGLFWSAKSGRRLLLITGSRGSQWYLPLETKAKRLWPSVRNYQQTTATNEGKQPVRSSSLMSRGMRRGTSCTDRRHQQQSNQDGASGVVAEAASVVGGHRSSLAGWRQYSTEKLSGIRQRVADWNPLGAGRSKSFLGFTQDEEDESGVGCGDGPSQYVVFSGEDGWKSGQVPGTLEQLDIGDGGRECGPYRLCPYSSGSADFGVKLAGYSDQAAELRIIDLEKNSSVVDSVYKIKTGSDRTRTTWTPTVIFRVSSRTDCEMPPSFLSAAFGSSANSASSYTPPPLQTPVSSSAVSSSSPQLTIYSCHMTKCVLDESHFGGGVGNRSQKAVSRPGLKWFNKTGKANSVAVANGHLPNSAAKPSSTLSELSEVVTDVEKSSPGVTVTKVSKKRPGADGEDGFCVPSKRGELDSASGALQSFSCPRRGEFILRVYPLDSRVLTGKMDEIYESEEGDEGVEEDSWMTCDMLPPTEKETWIDWCLVVTNVGVTLLYVPYPLERIILKNLICKKPATRAVEDARAIANAFASVLDVNGGIARVFHTAMDLFLSHNDLQAAVLMLRGALGTSLEDVKRLLVRKCIMGAMTYLSIELGELGQPGSVHTASQAKQMLSLQHLCRIHQYLMADKESDRAKTLMAQLRKCFWEPKTEWAVVILRGLIEARMWNLAAEYAAIHGLGSYFLEFSGYKGIELTEKPFRGSDGGDFKRILSSLSFGNVLAFSSKWRRVHSRWFRQCLASGGLANRDLNQDAADALLDFCELFNPSRSHYRALWLQQGNERKVERRFYPKMRLRAGFVPRLPSQTCPVREIFVWRTKGSRTDGDSPISGAFSSKAKDVRKKKTKAPHGAEVVENFLLALLTRQALCNASALRYRQCRNIIMCGRRPFDGDEEEEDDDDSEYDYYYCVDDEDSDFFPRRPPGPKSGAGAMANAGRRQSIAVARRRFRRKISTSVLSLIGGSSSESSSSGEDDSSCHHRPYSHHHHHHHHSRHEDESSSTSASEVRDDLKRRRAVMSDDGVRDAFRRQISAGHSHAAVTTGDNNVRVWGSALDGFIGLNRFDSLPCLPAPVPLFEKLRLKVQSVACGKKHTLALTTVGVFSWGNGSFGQLGLGPNIMRTADPVLIEKLIPHSVDAVSAGQYHSLATTRDGKVFSFGWGIHGQLGHGTVENVHTPTMIQSLAHAGLAVRKACGGQGHSLFLCHLPPSGSSSSTMTSTAAHAQAKNMYSHLYQHTSPLPGGEEFPAAIVVACGNGGFGQLGTMNTRKSLVPIVVPLPAELTTTSVVSGPPSCLSPVDGASTPIVTLTTTSADRIVDIDTSYFFNLALTRRGRVFRWGVSPHAMRWELNQFKPKLSALLGVRRANANNATAAVAAAHAAAAPQPATAPTAPQPSANSGSSEKESGSSTRNDTAEQQKPTGDGKQGTSEKGASGGGAGWNGKLIRQETLSKLTRKKFSSIIRKNASVGESSTVPAADTEVSSAPTVSTWNAVTGQSARKSEEDQTKPASSSTASASNNPSSNLPSGLSDLEKKQGIIVQYFLPTEVDLSSVRGNVVQASAGLYHCLLVDDLGTMYGWGRNLHGQLGLSSLTCPAIPTPADVPFSVMAVAAGAEFSLMVDHTGAVWSAGNNDCGQLGVKLPPAATENRPLSLASAIGSGGRSDSDAQAVNPFAGRVLSLRSNRGRVAFLRQNSVDAFSSTPKQIQLPEIVPVSTVSGTAASEELQPKKKPWFSHMDHYMDDKKLRDICESGIGRYDAFLILVQSLQLGNFLLASHICVVNRCWGPACLFALQHCVPATQRTEIKWSLRARDLDPDQPVSKEERRLIRRRSTRLRLGKDAELLKTQEGMLRILFGLEDAGSSTDRSSPLPENDVDRIGVGCTARATQDDRTLQLWAASKQVNNNDEAAAANWQEYPEISRVICEGALGTLKLFLDKIVAEEGHDKDVLFGELRTIAGILVRFWVDYGLPVIGLEELLKERMDVIAAPMASFVLSEEDPMTCEAFINALTPGFWIGVTRAAIKSGHGVPELEELLNQMTVDGGLEAAAEQDEDEADDAQNGNEGNQVLADARYSITIDGSQLTEAVTVSDGESWSPGASLVKVYSCGHALNTAAVVKENIGQRYAACPECVHRSQ